MAGEDRAQKRWSDRADLDPVPHPWSGPPAGSEPLVLLKDSEVCSVADPFRTGEKGAESTRV